MTASLIVAGYELIGTATNPEYRLSQEFDFGSGEPQQVALSSLYLDGETVIGDRTGNRTFSFTVLVRGTAAASLSAFVSTLAQAVNAETFTTQWTPDGGLPVVWDCFRAQVSRPRSLTGEAQGETSLVLTFQAKPFGRSTTTQAVTVIPSVQIDSFDTAPTGATLETTLKVEGTGSAKFTTATGTISRSFAAKNLAGSSFVTFQYRNGAAASDFLTGTLTLASASGSTAYTFNRPAISPFSWVLVTVDITSGTITAGSGVTLGSVTSYSLVLNNSAGAANYYVDDLRSTGTGSTQITTARATQTLLPGVIGSARTPANLTLTGSTTAFLLHTPPGTQDSNATLLSALSTASTDQTITIATANALYAGTYTVMLGVGTVGGGSVTATVTVTQLENGIAVGSTNVLTKAYTSGAVLLPTGEVTLPLYAVPSDNTLTTYTFRVQITGADRYSDLMLCDTSGQTIFTDSNLSTARAVVYVDEPAAIQSGPNVYVAATATRTSAYSALDSCVVSGGPILLDPGSNKLLVWEATAVPTITATYYPRWLDERTA